MKNEYLPIFIHSRHPTRNILPTIFGFALTPHTHTHAASLARHDSRHTHRRSHVDVLACVTIFWRWLWRTWSVSCVLYIEYARTHAHYTKWSRRRSPTSIFWHRSFSLVFYYSIFVFAFLCEWTEGKRKITRATKTWIEFGVCMCSCDVITRFTTAANTTHNSGEITLFFLFLISRITNSTRVHVFPFLFSLSFTFVKLTAHNLMYSYECRVGINSFARVVIANFHAISVLYM